MHIVSSTCNACICTCTYGEIVSLKQQYNIIRSTEQENMQCMHYTYIIIMYNLQALGNDLQVTKSGVEEFLPAATVMVVSVTASTTQGLVFILYEQEHCDGA